MGQRSQVRTNNNNNNSNLARVKEIRYGQISDKLEVKKLANWRETHRHSIPAHMLAEALCITLFHYLQGKQWELLVQDKEWDDDQEPAHVLLQPHVLEGARLHAALPLHVSGLKFRCSFVVFICMYVLSACKILQSK